MEYQSANEKDTESIAATLAQSAQPGDIFCLNGPLGAGKNGLCARVHPRADRQ
jgi:tRNA A37 threonylcarbamoyladenosine biosynthesis protein TsaE